MKWIASLTLFGLLALTFTTFATPPVATPSFGQTWEDTEGEVVLNYTDDDGDLATDCDVFNVVGGTVVSTSVVGGVCTVTISPDLNNDVDVTGNFTVTAGGEVSNISTFELDLIEVNDPPVIISAPPLTGQYGTSYVYHPVVEDVEGDDLTYTIISDNYFGPEAEGVFHQGDQLTWSQNFRGPVAITITFTDNGWTNGQPDPQSAEQVFTVIIQPYITHYEFDNSDPQFMVMNGWWNTYDLPEAIGGSLMYTQPGDQARVGWRVDQVVESGMYDMYAWQFPTGHDQLMARLFCYQHHYSLGIHGDCLHSEPLPHGQWVIIGRYPIDNTIPQGVTLRARPSGIVYADAVRYIKVNEWPPVDGTADDPSWYDDIPCEDCDPDSLADTDTR